MVIKFDMPISEHFALWNNSKARRKNKLFSFLSMVRNQIPADRPDSEK